jgi:hypothetical protein
MKQRGYICLFGVFITATFLFFFRLQIATVLFTKILEHTGAENIQLKLTLISSKEVVIAHAGCTLPGGNGSLSLENARLGWNSSSLTTKQLDRIIIDSLTLDLPTKTSARSKTKISNQTLIQQVEHTVKRLPFQNLQIRQLTLNGQAVGGFSEQELILKMHNKKSLLNGEVFLPQYNLRLSFTMLESNQWTLKVDESGLDDPMLTARINVLDEQLQTEITADISRFKVLNHFLNKPLPEMKGTLAGTLLLNLNQAPGLRLMLNLQHLNIAGVQADAIDLSLQGQVETPSKYLLGKTSSLVISGLRQGSTSLSRLTIELGGRIAQHNGQWLYLPDHTSEILLSGLSRAAQSIESVTVAPAMGTLFSGNIITLSLSPQWYLRAAGIHAGPVKIAEASLRPEQETIITFQADDNFSWQVSPSTWRLTPDAVLINNDLELTPKGPVLINFKKVEGNGAHWQTACSLTCQQLGITIPDNALTLLDISSELTADEDGIKGTAAFSPNPLSGTLSSHFSHNLKSGAGRAALKTSRPLTFSEITPLSSLAMSWPLPADLNGGTLQLQGSLQWQQHQPLRVFLQTELSAGRGGYKNTLFSGLTTRQNLQLLPILQSIEPGFISITEVDTGLVINNIATSIQLLPSSHGRIPRIELKDISASLFGGTVTDEYLLVDPQRIEVKNTILLHNIDLSELTTTQSIKGLEISGKIDGTLPYSFDDSGLRISEGKLQNTRNGGIIRYTLPEGTGPGDSPLTDYALKALEEFHYDHLSASVQYSPSGELRVGLHLEGKSPKLETSRPVHLNINTEQNVLSLLQSLRYSKTLTDEIDKNLQHHTW